MAAPGILEARYEQLAGPPHKRQEMYVAARRLGYGWHEWKALPWYARRAYMEGLTAEANARIDAQQPQQQRTGASGLDALYSGTLADVAATTGLKPG